jgi:uncharacterized membrane protein YuzA (DUF378 family)
MYSKEQLVKISTIIAAVGAINWALTALDVNIVNIIFGNGQNDMSDTSPLEKIIYLAVGASGLYLLYNVLGLDKKMLPKMKVYYF